MKKYNWKNEYNPIRRTAKRLLSGEPLTDGRPLSDLIELDEHTRKCLAFEATLTDRQIDMLQELGYRSYDTAVNWNIGTCSCSLVLAVVISAILILCMKEREATQTKKKAKKVAPKKGW